MSTCTTHPWKASRPRCSELRYAVGGLVIVPEHVHSEPGSADFLINVGLPESVEHRRGPYAVEAFSGGPQAQAAPEQRVALAASATMDLLLPTTPHLVRGLHLSRTR